MRSLPALITTGVAVTLSAGAMSGTSVQNDRAAVARLDTNGFTMKTMKVGLED